MKTPDTKINNFELSWNSATSIQKPSSRHLLILLGLAAFTILGIGSASCWLQVDKKLSVAGQIGILPEPVLVSTVQEGRVERLHIREGEAVDINTSIAWLNADGVSESQIKALHEDLEKILADLKSQESFSASHKIPQFSLGNTFVRQVLAEVTKWQDIYEYALAHENTKAQFVARADLKLSLETAVNKIVDYISAHEIKSTGTGHIQKIFAREEEKILAGEPIVSIFHENSESMVKLKVAPKDITQVHEGMLVQTNIQGPTHSEPIVGAVQKIDLAPDKEGMYTVTAKLTNLENYQFKNNLNVNAQLILRKRSVASLVFSKLFSQED